MARLARLKLAGEPWHVIQRGVNRSNCFFTDSDRLIYLDLLGRYSAEHGCSVHAYVLMSNHVHLLATPADDHAVSRMMKAIGERYVKRFNKTHHRTGTLWEGRFRSSIVDSRGYLLTCQRYIELNPVRAGVVAHPSQYPWSSYRANAEGVRTTLVRPHPLYLSMSHDAKQRQHAYREMFAAGLTSDELYAIREAVIGGFALGSSLHLWEVLGHNARRANRLKHSLRMPD